MKQNKQNKKKYLKKPEQKKNSLSVNDLINKHFILFSSIILVIAGFIVYSNSLDCSFHFDDRTSITDNPFIKNLSNLNNINYWLHPGRQIAFLSFALNYHFNKFDVFGYHIVNIFIHIITGIFCFLLIKLILNFNNSNNSKFNKYKNWLALFSALFFIVHPLQTQAITYIVQRMASMAAMFYIISVYLYALGRISHVQKNNFSRAIVFYIISLISGILAVMTKENAVTFPFAMLLFEFFFIRDKNHKIFKNYIILSSSIFVILSIVYLLLNPKILTSGATEGMNIGSIDYLINQFVVIVRYLQLTILPFNQCGDYGSISDNFPFLLSLLNFKVIGCFLLLIGLFVLAIYLYKKNKALSFGLFWFYLTLSIESSIIPIADPMFEHRMYLPMLGIGLFLISSLFLILNKIKPIYIFSFLSVLIVVLGITCYSRNEIWKNDLSLWSDVIKKTPYNARGYNNCGLAKNDLGDKEGAMKDYNRAIELNHDFVEALSNRGLLRSELGDKKGALLDYNQAIEIKHDFAGAYFNRGVLKMLLADNEGAIKDYSRAIELKSDYADAFLNRGLSKNNLNDNEGAINDYNRAIELNPSNATPFNNRGLIKYQLGNKEEAIKDYNRAIEIKPDYAEAYNGLASCYFSIKNYNKAISYYEKAIEINPNYTDAVKNLEIAKHALVSNK